MATAETVLPVSNPEHTQIELPTSDCATHDTSTSDRDSSVAGGEVVLPGPTAATADNLPTAQESTGEWSASLPRGCMASQREVCNYLLFVIYIIHSTFYKQMTFFRMRLIEHSWHRFHPTHIARHTIDLFIYSHTRTHTHRSSRGAARVRQCGGTAVQQWARGG